MSTNCRTYNPTQRRNAAKSMIADEAAKVKGGKMIPELEALYEGLCRREPALFEPEALLQLCEDWQRHAFAVGVMAAVRLLTKSSPLVALRGVD